MTGITTVTNGCSAHPDCYTCPFDDCVALKANSRIPRVPRHHSLELEQRRRSAKTDQKVYLFNQRAKLALAMHRAGSSNQGISEALSVSNSTAGELISAGLANEQRDFYIKRGYEATFRAPTSAVRPTGRLLYSSA